MTMAGLSKGARWLALTLLLFALTNTFSVPKVRVDLFSSPLWNHGVSRFVLDLPALSSAFKIVSCN